MHFTQEDYRKIEAWLYNRSIRDTELPLAHPAKGIDSVPILQEGKNKIMGFNNFVKQLSTKFPQHFYNVSIETCKYYISLEEAIDAVPVYQRKLGLVITFYNKQGNWVIYQFGGESITQWDSPYSWENIIYSALKELIFWPDEEDITAIQDGNRKFLKFKNRDYNPADFVGMGMVILRRNISGTPACSIDDEDHLINVLTQDMVSKPNTVYIVEYDFTLEGNNLIMPKNSVLWFQGGTINDGNIHLNETAILGAFEFADMGNCKLFGTFNTGQIMTFHNEEYKKKSGNYFSAYVKSSSATREEDAKQDTETTYIENTKAYTTSERQELRWWNGEEWVLILDITDYNEIKSIISDLIDKHNAEMSACYRYFKTRCYAIEKKADEAASDIYDLKVDLTTLISIIDSGSFTAEEAKKKMESLGVDYSTLYNLAKTLKSFLNDKDIQDSTINKWKEIEDFLQDITDQQTLTGLLQALNEALTQRIVNVENRVTAIEDTIKNLNDTITSQIENYLNSHVVGAKSIKVNGRTYDVDDNGVIELPNYPSTSDTANRLNHTLKFEGAVTGSFDGSADTTITVPTNADTVDFYHIRVLTTAEFNAIGTKDSNTIYFVKP